MQPAGPHRGPAESPSACGRREAAPKQKPWPNSALGPRQPHMAGRESWAWHAGQRVQGLPGTVQAQLISRDQQQQGCADPFRLRARRYSREEMGPRRHPGELLAQGGELRMLWAQPGGPQATSTPSQQQNPLSSSSSSSLCLAAGLGTAALLRPTARSSPCCPLRENQKHEYLKLGDEADTERIQARPSPAPSTVQEGTRSLCGSQHHPTHVPAASSCRWLAGGSSDAEMTPALAASWNTGTCSPLRAQILPGGLLGERGGRPGAGYR